MANESQPGSATPPDGNERYEKRDASTGWLFGIVAAVLVVIVCFQLLLYWAKTGLEHTAPPADSLAGARVEPSVPSSQPFFPRLQISPPLDLKDFRGREEAELDTYGWINSNSGVVRIPVDRAMDILLIRGFPVRAGTNQSRLGPSPFELQQQRNKATQPETAYPR